MEVTKKGKAVNPKATDFLRALARSIEQNLEGPPATVLEKEVMDAARAWLSAETTAPAGVQALVELHQACGNELTQPAHSCTTNTASVPTPERGAPLDIERILEWAVFVITHPSAPENCDRVHFGWARPLETALRLYREERAESEKELERERELSRGRLKLYEIEDAKLCAAEARIEKARALLSNPHPPLDLCGAVRRALEGP